MGICTYISNRTYPSKWRNSLLNVWILPQKNPICDSANKKPEPWPWHRTIQKKYKTMENVLIHINANVIAMQDKEKKRNTVILDVVVDKVLNIMKEKDVFLRETNKEMFYGGSFYDNLKVGNPNEFDLDLVLNLPGFCGINIQSSDRPGYIHVQLPDFAGALSKRPDAEKIKFEKLKQLMDNSSFLCTTKVLPWLEGLVTKALTDLDKDADGNCYIDVVVDRSKPGEVLRIFPKVHKAGPAFTLKLNGTGPDRSKFQLDIDLVPCIGFTEDKWPGKSGGYRANPSQRKSRFLVVPKKPNGMNNNAERYWRLSFQEQERELIGGDKKNLKPALRLLKKLRDKYNHKIASYFIKTVFLWAVQEEKADFWTQPLSVVFMLMLKKYEKHLRNGEISYYWNRKFNLIQDLKPETKMDIAQCLARCIGHIDRNLDDPVNGDPFIVGKYLLSDEELAKLKEEVPIPKKWTTRIPMDVLTQSSCVHRQNSDISEKKTGHESNG
ncbi:cyclic GMP-AMP synthase-like receptor isoform X2 [Anthonomus grandis grandis]|uniref:cyclic GMP-AMP synthase-like receptor isoform X2 n=1 Tax=Anthonomus grandis grandis TaxID=2921223 RepID=UPI0021659166|nr:cyclic GMP-AMP synthase-like receptor isoform X2 [Anthonomus grandis grandis]